MSDPNTTHLTLFTALRKQCDVYNITGNEKVRLSGSGILDLVRRPEAIEVDGGFVVDGPDPMVVVFASLNASEDYLSGLPDQAQKMLVTARRLKLQTEIAAHRSQIENLTRQLNELNRDRD